MSAKKIHFLAGLPRCGSTLLGSILNRDPALHVTPTSPLYVILNGASKAFDMASQKYSYDRDVIIPNVLSGIINGYFSNIQEPIIFDKNRLWQGDIDAIIKYITPMPKIICPIRPIPEIIASYLSLVAKDPDNFIDRNLRMRGDPVHNEYRAYFLWNHVLKIPYENLVSAYKKHRTFLHFINYRDLVFNPDRTLKKLYDFCELEPFSHSFNEIENTCLEENDRAWQLKDLHTLRPVLSMQSTPPLAYLSKEIVQYFSQFDLRPAT